jgi:hypothetical protein
MSLAELFPDTDYQFHFRFERGEAGNFFGRTDANESLLAERRRWLQENPKRYAALLPEGADLLDEATVLAVTLGEAISPGPTGVDGFGGAWSRCLALGMSWEPDFLLLKSDRQGAVRLVGGSVCFPSGWSLEEKIGHPIETIHGVVPGLNAAIGPQIQGFLTRLRPGIAWLRSNWGLSRGSELNLHPARNLPRLDATVRLDEVWLRVERQALFSLTRSQSILFGIRIELHPLAEIAADQELARRLARALRTMPEELARYKGLVEVRERVIESLGG